MGVDIGKIKVLLKSADFYSIFIEELGWNSDLHEFRVNINDETFILKSVAQKAGMVVLVHFADDEKIPNYLERKKIETEVTKQHYEHIIIYTNSQKSSQLWQWVKREPGKPAQCRQKHYHNSQNGEALSQILHQISFSIEEEEKGISIIEVSTKVRSAFDLERVTKRFYDRFKSEHESFYKFISGIPNDDMHRWYASIMLNRLMFIYFIQPKQCFSIRE